MTQTTNAIERYPAWSPDGKSIAYFSDVSGEYELHVQRQDQSGPAKRIRIEDSPGYYYAPVWSPDSKRLAFRDAHLRVWMVEIENSKAGVVDTDRYWGRPFEPVWSPDSKWIAYAKTLAN